MKKVSLLILVSLVLLLVLASCSILPQPVKDALGIHEHKWTDATCTAPKTCECGETEGTALGHTWTDATCDAPKTCSVCQATEGEALGHDWKAATCTDPKTCKNCGKTDGKAPGHDWLEATCTLPKTCEICQATEGEALGHKPAAAVKENAVAPTCDVAGKYDLVVYCSACKAEVSREKDVVDPATGHTPGAAVQENAVAPTCTVAGSYENVVYCTVEGCRKELSRETVTVDALGHTPGAAVKENETAPTCTAGGSHDEVVYCTVETCKAEISRTPVTTDPLGHTPGEAVKENVTAPTCTVGGSHDEVVYCTVETCGAEISRTHVTTDPLGHDMAPATCQAPSTCSVCGVTEGDVVDHKAGEVVKENEVAPDCETAGSYDNVTYCVWCQTETSRENVPVDALGHDMAPATCQAPSTCKNGCGKIEGTTLNHKFVATYGTTVSYACPMCNTTYTMERGTYNDGTTTNNMSPAGNVQHGYATEAPAIVDGHIELVLQNNVDYKSTQNGGTADQNAAGQHQIWVPTSSSSGLTGLTAANNAIGVLSFDMNIRTDNPDMHFRLQLVDTSSSGQRWSPEWCIKDYVFLVDPVLSEDQTTVDVYGWGNKKIGTLTLGEDKWTGWVNVALVLIPDEENLTVHYYVNNEYWESITLPLTTSTKGINTVYFTGSTVSAGTGFKYDNIAFGCVSNADWTLDVHSHTWIAADCENAKICYICGATEGDPLGHTEATKDENFIYPDCVNTGSHEHVTYCTVCEKELTRETVTDAALGHLEQIVPGTPATCTEGGMSDGKICTREGCKTPTLEAQKPIAALGHVDDDDDKICDVCTTDLTCNHEGTERVPVAGTPATCTAPGLTEGEKCAKCGEFTVAQTEIPALGHTNGEVQKLNVTEPTCTEPGKHDEQIWCTVCNELVSETKDVVDPATGHTEVQHEGKAATCTENGWNAYVTCEKCDYTTYEEIAALGHKLSEATCIAASTCSVCGETVGTPEVNNHKYVKGTSGSDITYTCSACNHVVTVETYYNFTGNNVNDFAHPVNGNISLKVEDGVYVFTNDDDTQFNSGNGGNQYMAWIPSNNVLANMNGFSCANNASGLISFRMSTNVTKELTAAFSMPRNDTANWQGWGKSDINVFQVTPAADGKVTIKGGFECGTTFATVSVGEDGWSEWFDVQIFIDLDNKGNITLHYYVNGTYYLTCTRNMVNPEGKNYIATLDVRTFYINGYSKGKGTGFKIDDILFGYSAHSHDITPVVNGNTVVYACDCGATFKVEDKHLDYNGASASDFFFGTNGASSIKVNEAGQYEVMFTPKTDAPGTGFVKGDGVTLEEKDAEGNKTGWFEYGDEGRAGGQPQPWFPAQAFGFSGFSAQNSSVGILSFSMKSNMTGTEGHPEHGNNTVSIGKHRGHPDWNGGLGSWTDDSINIFTICGVDNGTVALKGGLNGTNIALTTVPVVDGWSEWFDVMIVIEFEGTYLHVYYYINGAYCGSDSRDLDNPGSYRTLDPKEINAVQFSGWTYAANTGYVFDNFLIGSTPNGHNTFDGRVHVLPEGADCSEAVTCSCGWTGIAVDHDYTEATCAAPATCKACGATSGDVLPHTITCANVDGKPTYGCSECDAKFTLNSQYLYYDGTNVNDLAAHYTGTDASFNGGQNKYVSDGEAFVGISDQDATVNNEAQLQMWVPKTKDATASNQTFTDFTLENASVGAFSIKLNLKFAYQSDIIAIKLVDNAWGAAGCIDIDLINASPVITDGTVTAYKIQGYGTNPADTSRQVIATIPAGEDGWSGWIDIKVILEMNPATGNLEAYYFVNGVNVANGAKAVTTTNKRISCVYINVNSWKTGTGVKLDDIAFGHTIGGHNVFDGNYHKVTETNCGEKSTCVCGWTGYTIAHDFTAATCAAPATCKGCGATEGYALPHQNLTATYGETVTYSCSDCNHHYAVDGIQYYLDGTHYDGMNGSSNSLNNGYTVDSNGMPNMVDGHYELLADADGGQAEITLPSNGHAHGLLEGFEAANGAIGFLSFKMDVWAPNGLDFLQLTDSQVRKIEGASFWTDGALPRTLNITAPTAEGDKTYVTIKGWDGIVLAKVDVTGKEQPFTGWIDLAIVIEFRGDNVALSYYVDGAYKGTATKVNNVITKAIDTAYFSINTPAEGAGIKLDDIVFGYTTTGLHENVAPEAPFYKEVIAKENVTNDVLKAVVDSKFKQADQCTTVNAQGGTPVYVVADKNGEDVQAMYVSRTYAWAGNEAEQFTEFRFDVVGKATSITFDYKIKGTVEENDVHEFTDLAGNKFYADAYVQIKTPETHPGAGDNYPELSGTDLVLDGEWHTMTYTFEEPTDIINILFNLYHFQGEMLLANLAVTFAE